ncbi:MAG: GNAT family N-acetyltransferase [Cyanobacteria bacterium P01_E01_bin.42]
MDCRHIQFQDSKSIIDLAQLQELFIQAAFWAKDRNMAEMEIAIENSNPTITVWDGDRLIGFARATSDGIYRATIWDVVIHPDYQGAGLGRKLVETVIAHPQVNRVERIYLMTTHQQHFYERIGFEENQTTTMILYGNANRLVTPLLVSPQKPEVPNTVAV